MASPKASERHAVRGHEKAGDADELQARPRDVHERQEPVDERHGQVERLVVEVKLLADVDEPVHQHRTHPNVDVPLARHVPGTRPTACLQRGRGEKREKKRERKRADRGKGPRKARLLGLVRIFVALTHTIERTSRSRK